VNERMKKTKKTRKAKKSISEMTIREIVEDAVEFVTTSENGAVKLRPDNKKEQKEVEEILEELDLDMGIREKIEIII
jgi:hypothetical protein